MNSGQIFEPYETLYVDNTKQYGNINLANNRNKMLEELPQGGGFSKLPFYCYAYDSIFSQATHLNIPSYSSGEAIIRGTPVEYGDWVKHYISFYPNMLVQNCLGDTERISLDNYNNNIGAFKPLDINFTKVRLGMRYGVFHKGTKQGIYVDSTKELLENYNTDEYVVRETQCNIMYFIDGGLYSYNSNGTSDISVNFNVGDQWVFGNHPLEYSQHGLQLVPQWWIRLRNYGTEAYSPFHDADTGFLFQGMGIDELKLSTQDEFYDLNTGCLLYRSNLFYDGVEFRPVLTVEQCLKEVAFLGLAVCDFTDPNNNLYMGYINGDGLATGKLIPYSEWDKSDSLNIKYEVMTDFPDIEIKPKPTSDDYDDDPSDNIGINIGAPSGAGAFANVWLMTASELQSLSVWMNGIDLPYDFSPMANVISLGMSGIDLSQMLGETKELVWTTYGTLLDPTTTVDRKIIHSGVSSKLITGTVVSYNLGSITINRRMQERGVPFLDYDCGLEIYIPFCGIIPLDIQACMDRTLSVQLNCDVTTGSCCAIVYAGTSPVGYTSGSFMSSLPIASNEFGLVKSAILEGTVKSIFAGLGAVANVYSGNPVAVTQGLMETGTRFARTANKGNSNMTSMSGSFGGADAFRLPKEAYIKISRPRFKIPTNYGHTVSKIRIKTELISECSGLTICVNPDTSGLSCTDDERKLIKEKLEQGIIC